MKECKGQGKVQVPIGMAVLHRLPGGLEELVKKKKNSAVNTDTLEAAINLKTLLRYFYDMD